MASPYSLPQHLVPNKEEYFVTLHSISDVDEFAQYALDGALSIADAHAGSLFLWDEFKKEFVLKAARGPYVTASKPIHVKLREGILGSIGDRGESVLVKDINEDMRFHSVKRNGDYRSDSFISIPLIANNKLFGVINITERENCKPFGEADLGYSQQFARHIAIAYENLRMIQNLKRDCEELHSQISDLKQEIKREETFVAIGKLGAHLTHELNNPLDAIRRYVNLALDQLPEDSLGREYLLKAKKGIRRAIRIIRGLLLFSREFHKRTIRTVEVHELIEESLASILHEIPFNGITIEKKYCKTPTVVHDRGLVVVLRNLYRNAHQAMQGNGILTVSTELNNGVVRLAVEDTGDGIPEPVREHIFEPFVSSKEDGEGTGMGLTLCREIVQQCGGEITCENGDRRGARFTITLPCLAGPEQLS